MNRPIKGMDIITVIKNLLTNKSPGPDGFMGKFYQKLREQLTPKTYPIQTLPEKLPKSFYDATITLIPKPDKDATKKHKKRRKKKIIGQYH